MTESGVEYNRSKFYQFIEIITVISILVAVLEEFMMIFLPFWSVIKALHKRFSKKRKIGKVVSLDKQKKEDDKPETERQIFNNADLEEEGLNRRKRNPAKRKRRRRKNRDKKRPDQEKEKKSSGKTDEPVDKRNRKKKKKRSKDKMWKRKGASTGKKNRGID